MKKIRMAAVFAAGSIAALGIAGTALADNGADDPTPHSSASASVSASPEVTPSAGASASTGVGVGLAAAKRIAVQAAGGGSVESVEREAEHGRAVWKVDVIVGGVEHDIRVDVVTGAVTRHRIKGSTGGAATATPTTHATSRGTDDHGREAEPGDDHGGGNEPGDDHGGRSGGGHGSDD